MVEDKEQSCVSLKWYVLINESNFKVDEIHDLEHKKQFTEYAYD